jgi:hypothetical protein
MTRYVPQHRFKLRQTLTSRRYWTSLRKTVALVVTGFAGVLIGLPLAHAPAELEWFALGTGAAWAVGATAGVALVVLAARVREKRGDRPLARFSVCRLTDLAAVLAGRKGPVLRAEWRAHLAGESGHDPVTWRKVKEALGFVASASRCRCSDAADAAWTPVDAVFKSRTLSNLFPLMPSALAALILFRHGGTIGLLGSAESVSTIYLMFYALVLAGRKYRNVKPPEPKARRAKEQ